MAAWVRGGRLRRTGSLVAVLAVVVAAAGCSSARALVMRWKLAPRASFAETVAPAAPDYSVAASWAARPDVADLADVAPPGLAPTPEERAAADVFFVHPTTFYSSAGWNQPLPEPETDARTTRGVLRNQASVFNGCCRVWAPFYRQVTLWAFFTDAPDGPAAIDLAYGDVLRAFDTYLARWNEGRPIVLAGHSQGARHVLRLLADRFTGTPLGERLVAAYAIGTPVSERRLAEHLPDVPVCASPHQTGCFVTWASVGPDVDRARFEGRGFPRLPRGWEFASPDDRLVCVNPLTWAHDEAPAPPARNEGGFRYEFDADVAAPPAPGLVGARCDRGVLVITDPSASGYTERVLGRDDYHVYDYSLFYLNLRRNAAERVAAFLARP